MSLYTLALFAHIFGVIGLVIGVGLQWTLILRLRRARSVAQVRAWSGFVGGARRIGPISGAIVIIAGVYLVIARWSFADPWVVVSLVAVALMMIFGMGVAGRRLKAIGRAAAMVGDGSGEAMPAELERRLQDRALWVAMQLAASVALGIVFLMTVKPDLTGALLTLAVALLLGGIVGLTSARPKQAAEMPGASLEEARVS